ncbi:uncharacterized protein LOC125036942 [Penaeus chinensis]|uniref:uncharacterized protein LOC125036942 n=1 Tax=Penaeus chinensis TaxID=139456 RepID=UPI001FB73AAD|nr:uncharacterized protein LOC125036942 [Penaeus chinensis]
MAKEARGFVRIFNFSSFMNRSYLNYDARIMSDVFDNMGYMCKTHSSLTAQRTKEVLKNIRDADVLKGVGCAIFVISGYGAQKRSQTFDLHLIHNTSEVTTNSANQTPKTLRLADPLNDMAYIPSNNNGLNCVPNGKGTSFNWCLCRTLADHAADQELGDLYR